MQKSNTLPTQEEIKSIDQYEKVEELIKNTLGREQNEVFSKFFQYDSKTYEIKRTVSPTKDRGDTEIIELGSLVGYGKEGDSDFQWNKIIFTNNYRDCGDITISLTNRFTGTVESHKAIQHQRNQNDQFDQITCSQEDFDQLMDTIRTILGARKAQEHCDIGETKSKIGKALSQFLN